MSQYFLTQDQIDNLNTEDDEYAAFKEESLHLGYVERPKNDHDAFICSGCGVNTLEISEYYSLKLKIWLAGNHGLFRGMRCLSCVETNLGRELVTDDFTDAPVNYWFPMSVKMFKLVAPIQKQIIDSSKLKKSWKRPEYKALEKRLDFVAKNTDVRVVK